MYVDVDPSQSPAVALRQADDFGSFKIVVRGIANGDPRLADVLEPHGWLAPEGDAFLWIDAVQALAGEQGPAWQTQFDAMVAYARGRGWLSEDGSAIRSHCEYLA